MSNAWQETTLRRLYSDICRGYSSVLYRTKKVYIKHLNIFDQTEIDAIRDDEYDKIILKGIRTEADKLKWLGDKGLWTRKDESDLMSNRSYITNLEKTKSKAITQVQVDQINKQIIEAQITVNLLSHRRESAIGLTAEKVADQKVQYEYIRLSFYEDENLKNRCFTSYDIANFNDDEVAELLNIYITTISKFNNDLLKYIVIYPFFTNQFYLLEEEIYHFFGKPISHLSMLQVNLLTYGKYFKHLLTNNEIPQDIANNPTKIEEYVLRSRNRKNIVDKAGTGDRVGIVGATAEDFKAMGVEDGSSKVQAEINKGYKSVVEASKNREIVINPPR